MLTFDFSKRHYTTQWWSKHIDEINKEFTGRGYTSIEILPFLKGKPWAPPALAYVLAENPRCLRVTNDMISLDCSTGRITVFVEKDGLIRKIQKEIDIQLPEGFTCGDDMEQWVRDPEKYQPKEWPKTRNTLEKGFVYCPYIPKIHGEIKEYASPEALKELEKMILDDLKK